MCNTPDCPNRTFNGEPYCYDCREDIIRPLNEFARSEAARSSQQDAERHFQKLLQEDS